MKAIILSAGQGRRLLPLTENTPKCALPVGETTALDWQLRALEAADASEVVVATGFHAEKVDQIIEKHNQRSGMPARSSLNPFYASCDNLGTCWIVRHEMTAPFTILNGDTLFVPEVFRRLMATADPHPITLVTNRKESYDSDDMKVIAENGELKRIGKHLEIADVTHESIGMMRFNDVGAAKFVHKIETLMQSESTLVRWYLSAIDELAADELVGIEDITGLGWCEIDDADDLAHASRVVPGWW